MDDGDSDGQRDSSSIRGRLHPPSSRDIEKKQRELIIESVQNQRKEILHWEDEHGGSDAKELSQDAAGKFWQTLKGTDTTKQMVAIPPKHHRTTRSSSYSPRKRRFTDKRGGPVHIANFDRLNQSMRKLKLGREAKGSSTNRSNNDDDSKREASEEESFKTNSNSDAMKENTSKDKVLTRSLRVGAEEREIAIGENVMSKYYLGMGNYDWFPCVVKEKSADGRNYLIEWDVNGELKLKWVAWTNVWQNEKESIEMHEERIENLMNNAYDAHDKLVTDPIIPVHEYARQEECSEQVFIRNHVDTISDAMIKRLVYLSKPVYWTFASRLNPLFNTNNSPRLWRTILEEVHENYLQGQLAFAVRDKMQQQTISDIPCQDEQTKTAFNLSLLGRRRHSCFTLGHEQAGKVRRKVEIHSSRSFLFHEATIRALHAIRKNNLEFQDKISFFEPMEKSSPQYLDDFKSTQDLKLSKALEKLRSNWLITTYHILLAVVIGKKPFFENRVSPHLRRLLRLIRLMMSDTLCAILVSSLETIESTFLNMEHPIFVVDACMSTISRAEALMLATGSPMNDNNVMQIGNKHRGSNENGKKRNSSKHGKKKRDSQQLAWVGAELLHDEMSGFAGSSGSSSSSDEASSSSSSSDDEEFHEHLEDQESFNFTVSPNCDLYLEAVVGMMNNIRRSLEVFPCVDSMVLDDHVEDCMDLFILDRHGDKLSDLLQELKTSLILFSRKPTRFCQDYMQSFGLKIAGLSALERAHLFQDEAETLDPEICMGRFILNMTDLRKDIQQRAKVMRETYLQGLLESVLKECDILHEEYVGERSQLTAFASKVEDLERVWLAVGSIPKKVKMLAKKIKRRVTKTYDLLEANQFPLSTKNWKRKWEIYALPGKLAHRANSVRHEVESKKHDLRHSLEEQLAKHMKRVREYATYLDRAVMLMSLDKIDENAVNLSLMEEKMRTCHERSISLVTKATSFELDVAPFQKACKETERLVDEISPLALLWGSAADIAELSNSWFKGSLLKLNVSETLERVKSVRDSELLGKIDQHNIVWNHIQHQIDAVLETTRLVKVFTTKGIQHHHWRNFSSVFKTRFLEPDYETTLEFVLEEHRDLLDKIDDLEIMARTASVEFENDQALDDMELRLKRLMEKVGVKYWELEALIQEQMMNLELIRKTETFEKVKTRVMLWEEYILRELDHAQKDQERSESNALEQISRLREAEPMYCLLPDEFLVKNISRLDVMTMLPYLFPYYGIPANMVESSERRYDLFQTENRGVSKNKTVYIATVVNDNGEQLGLPTPIEPTSFEAVQVAVGKALQMAFHDCFHYLSSNQVSASKEHPYAGLRCIPDSVDTMKDMVERWPRQVCILAYQVLLSSSWNAAKNGRLFRSSERQLAKGSTQYFQNVWGGKATVPQWDMWSRAVFADIHALVGSLNEVNDQIARMEKLRSLQQAHVGRREAVALGLEAALRSQNTLQGILLVALNCQEHQQALLIGQQEQQKQDRIIEEELNMPRYNISEDDGITVSLCFPSSSAIMEDDEKEDENDYVSEGEGEIVLPYGFEFTSGLIPPLLLLPTCRWHLALTRTFYLAKESVLIKESKVGVVFSMAAAFGKHCQFLRVESQEDLDRVQFAIQFSSTWIIVQDRCSWAKLSDLQIPSLGIVYTSEKPVLPKHIQDALRPCHVNVNLEALMKQCLVGARLDCFVTDRALPKQGRRRKSVCSTYYTHSPIHSDTYYLQHKKRRQASEDSSAIQQHQQERLEPAHVLEFFMSKHSDANAWERYILKNLRRTGESTWCGKPTKIVIHDAKTPEERMKNPECSELLERLQDPVTLSQIQWHFVHHQGNFVPNPTIVSDLPQSVKEPTILLLPKDRKDILEYLQTIPSNDELLVINENHSTENAVIITCVEDSLQLRIVENDFPRIKRNAVRLLLDPWWFHQDELEARSNVEDPTIRRSAAKWFLVHCLRPGLRPHHYFKFLEIVKQKVTERMVEASQLCHQNTQKLEHLGTLEKLESQERLTSKRERRYLVQLREESPSIRKEIAELTSSMDKIPDQVVEQVASSFSFDEKLTDHETTSNEL